MHRYAASISLLIVLLGGFSSPGAQPDPVLLDGKLAHPTRLIARFPEVGPAEARVRALAGQRLGVTRSFSHLPGLHRLDLQDGAEVRRLLGRSPQARAAALRTRIENLRATGLFTFVEPDYAVSVNATSTDAAFTDGRLWGLRNLGQNGGRAGVDVDAERAWRHTTGSSNVVVAVIDTGVRYTHLDLAQQMWINPGEIAGNGIDDDRDGYVDDLFGINTLDSNGDPMDENGHGTHVAGTIGAAANNGYPHVGIAWQLRLMALKFLGQKNDGYTGDSIECINYAVAKRANIINASYGTPSFSEAVREAVAAANAAGILFVASAGNDTNDVDRIPSYPASYDLPNIVSVAALDRRGDLADFSNYGLAGVDVGAPGVAILSCLNTADDAYGLKNGTSMAAPHVSGVAALIRSLYPGIPVARLRQYLLDGAVSTPSLEGKTVTGGRVDAFRALSRGDTQRPTIAFQPWTDGTRIDSFSRLGGTATDDFEVSSVTFTLREDAVLCAEPRWWNGSAWQASSAELPATVTSGGWVPDALLELPSVRPGLRYTVAATARDPVGNTAAATVQVVSDVRAPDLAWDPGIEPHGTMTVSQPDTLGGAHLFRIVAQGTAVGAWRTALRVTRGEANLFMQQGSPPAGGRASHESTREGSDGWVLHASEYSPGQEWYILVCAEPDAEWTLVSGQAFAHDLGTLAGDASSGTNVVVLPEGLTFFKSRVPSDTLAWRLWLTNDATGSRRVYVKKSTAAHPRSYDLSQPRQMLVVPDYLGTDTFEGSYFVAIPGVPDERLGLDSRKQPVTDIDFEAAGAAQVVSGFPYVTYRVRVPVDQIAWEIGAIQIAGNPNLAVRRDKVPNEFNNDAYSEAMGDVNDSLSLVPPTLSDGTFYITVYGEAPFAFSLRNRRPLITTIPFKTTIENDDPRRAGWRYYVIHDIPAQLGALGWDLLLAGQAPGTEIALRRNAVPGRWNLRSRDGATTSSSGHVDLSSLSGFLQQPGHQADIWYVGVYTPEAALGPFVLNVRPLEAVALPMDGGSGDVRDQPAGSWRFFRVDVPSEAPGLLGWDLRLLDASGPGRVEMVVRRDALPADLGTTQALPGSTGEWPSGAQFRVGLDWTRYPSDALGRPAGERTFTVGLGNPLQPGTYYIGMFNVSAGTNSAGYSLLSRGIGTAGQSIPVTELNYRGQVTGSDLMPREAAYYRVKIGEDTPSWRLRLSPTVGESMLVAQAGWLPHNLGASGVVYGLEFRQGGGLVIQRGGGREQRKPGKEHLALLQPYGTYTNLPPGEYYLAVVSEGVNPVGNPGFGNSRLGTNAVGYTLESLGPAVPYQLGTLGDAGLVKADTQEFGEYAAYQFDVPAGLAALEIRLDERVGNPWMRLALTSRLFGARWADGNCSTPPQYDGNDRGDLSEVLFEGGRLITVPEPKPGVYTLAIGTLPTPSDCRRADVGYTLQIRGLRPEPLAFDGGRAGVADLSAGAWRYFEVEVPAGDPTLLGWDLRLTEVTGGGWPQMHIRRDLLPTASGGGGGINGGSSAWASGQQWSAWLDWTSYNYEVSGEQTIQRVLTVGMGNPLEPGRYFVGVQNVAADSKSLGFTLVSRAIGTGGQTIPVHELGLVGTATRTGLPPREAAYYRVVVPEETPTLRIRLTPEEGEALLVAQAGWLPNTMSQLSPGVLFDYRPVPGGYRLFPTGGNRRQKPGREHLALLPDYRYPPGSLGLPPGEYYLAVVSEGQRPTSQRIGTNSVSYTLETLGRVAADHLGVVGAADLVRSATQEYGEYAAYQFEVPPGVSSVEVRLENTVGGPWMNLAATNRWVAGGVPNNGGGYLGSYFGLYSQWQANDRITLADPVPGTYTLAIDTACVRDPQVGCEPSDVGYTIRVRSVGAAPLAFDGGRAVVTDHLPGEWRYFRVEVPEGDPTLLGWDLRLLEVNGSAGSSLAMIVRRDLLPDNANAADWNLFQGTRWPVGQQLMAGLDWSNYSWEATGEHGASRTLTMGMGQPLESGTYYVGIRSASPGTVGYTVRSRAIGTGRQTIPVRDLDFVGGIDGSGLAPREAAYYRVVVPENTPSWKLRLTPAVGESLLIAKYGWIPNSGQNSSVGVYRLTSRPDGTRAVQPTGGRRQQKAGSEHLTLLPAYDDGLRALPAGAYYLAVVSEGVRPTQDRIGTNAVSYRIESLGSVATNYLGMAGATDLVRGGAQEFGEYAVYQFEVPAGLASVEVRLENRVGNPTMTLAGTERLVASADGFSACYLRYPGSEYGQGWTWQGDDLITLVEPSPGLYTLAIGTLPVSNGTGPWTCLASDTSYTIRVRVPPVSRLGFSPEFDGAGLSSVVGGHLADNQRSFFEVSIPSEVQGAPVLGWRLVLRQENGSAQARVRRGALPNDREAHLATTLQAGSLAIVPPLLEPGTWYVEVKGAGNTDFRLSSRAITTNTLSRVPWSMPGIGEADAGPGLTLPVFGDTGTASDGTPLTGDRGVDLEQGDFHYYAVVVPAANAGLLRTELLAISGNPDLYVRVGAAPTLTHGIQTTPASNPVPAYDRVLAEARHSEYGNWVPLDGRSEAALAPGLWIFAVHAAGNANCRYRLSLSCGNALAGALVQELPANGTRLEDQRLSGRDWRYYRFSVPPEGLRGFALNLGRVVGGARVYLRDTVPPGDGTRTGDYDSTSYRPVDWSSDRKNSGPYGQVFESGAYRWAVPPLRPGSTYYLGVWSATDSTFGLSLTEEAAAVSLAGDLEFYGGQVDGILSPHAVAHYRIEVPPEASRLRLSATNAASVRYFLEQGTLASPVDGSHWMSSGANPRANLPLSPAAWPWRPGFQYYLAVTNTAEAPQPFSVRVEGVNAESEDEDGDGLPDAWETARLGNTWQFNGLSDPDVDGVRNIDEFRNGSDPVIADRAVLSEPAFLANGTFRFLFTGPRNARYQAEYRSELVPGAWRPMVVFTNEGGTTWIIDTNAASMGERYYRTAPFSR